METVSAKTVFAVLALAITATAGAHIPADEARQAASIHQASAALLAEYPVPQVGQVRGGFEPHVQQPLLIASAGARQRIFPSTRARAGKTLPEVHPDSHCASGCLSRLASLSWLRCPIAARDR
jgi:hypothetical protein